MYTRVQLYARVMLQVMSQVILQVMSQVPWCPKWAFKLQWLPHPPARKGGAEPYVERRYNMRAL